MSSIEFLGLALGLSVLAGAARGLAWTPPRFAGAANERRAGPAEEPRATAVVSPPAFWVRERPRPLRTGPARRTPERSGAEPVHRAHP